MTATRVLYQAKSGLLAWRPLVTVERGIVLGHLRQIDLSLSTNRDTRYCVRIVTSLGVSL